MIYIILNVNDPRINRKLPFMIQYLFCEHPVDFINFVEKVFNAAEQRERTVINNQIQNALFDIAGTLYEISQSRDKFPQACHSFHLYTNNQKELIAKSLEFGCEIKYQEVKMDYGDIESWIVDPFGNNWFIATPY